MANVRKRVNYIGKIRTNFSLTSDPIEVKEEIANYFERLYPSDNLPRPSLEGVAFPSIPPSLMIWLERDFEEEDVRVALAECGGDKAPGRDGLNFSFIHVAWDVLKQDFIGMLSEFHRCKLNK